MKSKITNREKEVMLLISQGKTREEVAVLLKISDQTVKSHMDSIRFKLNARNTPHAMALALADGLLST